MADFAGTANNDFGETAFAGPSANRLYDPNLSAQSKLPAPTSIPTPSFAGVLALGVNLPTGNSVSNFAGVSVVTSVAAKGVRFDEMNASQEWFESIVLLPRAIDLGNVITVQVFILELFNADRVLPHTLQAFINNAGAGLSITDLPTLPVVIPYMTHLLLTLEATADGPPNIDGTLDFLTDLYTVFLPIIGNRIVMFPFRPERGYTETLRFLTEVIDHLDRSEQRIKLRKNPRQEFAMRVRLDGSERQALQALLFGWQSRVFGLPIWHETSLLTVAASSGATVLTVDTTAYGDFRVGGLLIVFKDRLTFDAIEIASIGANSFTLSTSIANNYEVGTEVMPIRFSVLAPGVRGARKPVKIGDEQLRFRVTDNNVEIASAAAFATLSGKVLLSTPNLLVGDLPEAQTIRLYSLDNATGIFGHRSFWDRNKRSHQKGFRTGTRQQLWEARQLLHFLDGRLVSFYIPTFFDEFTAALDLASGSNTLTIENIGYTKYIENKKGLLRVVLNDGTTYVRTVTSSAEIDAATEQLTLDTTWPVLILKTSIKFIEYVELVRFDSDDIEIQHLDGLGNARILASVLEVSA